MVVEEWARALRRSWKRSIMKAFDDSDQKADEIFRIELSSSPSATSAIVVPFSDFSCPKMDGLFWCLGFDALG